MFHNSYALYTAVQIPELSAKRRHCAVSDADASNAQYVSGISCEHADNYKILLKANKQKWYRWARTHAADNTEDDFYVLTIQCLCGLAAKTGTVKQT